MPEPKDVLPLAREHEDTRNPADQFAREVRRLRKLLGKALLERTRWQQERQTAEHCRDLLHQSTVKLMTAMQLHKEVGELHGTPRKVRKKKGSNRTRQGSYTGEPEPTYRIPSTRIDSGVSDGNDGTSQHQSLGTDVGTETTDSFDIPELFERYERDYEALRRTEQKFKAVTDALNNLEFRVEQRAEAINLSMRSANFAAELRSQMLEGTLAASDSTSQASAASSRMPSIVAQLFDHKADINIFAERLQELDYNHQEGRAERAFLADQGQELRPSDEEYELNYSSRRREIEQDYDRAQSKAALLSERCKEAGLDPDVFRRLRMRQFLENEATMESTSDPGSAGSAGYVDFPMPRVYELPQSPPFHLPGQGVSTHRVANWLNDLAAPMSNRADSPPPIEPSQTPVSQLPDTSLIWDQEVRDVHLASSEQSVLVSATSGGYDIEPE